ncbi:DAK2 domain-containing protein [Nocardia sp. alder85J]|uniref:DAK2 domain-containing protein n=1 Tax=Nocardia sp. alder85J TaxID=2862949 RepID=UPI001CD64210|nr:DAK2 domain-containing protein [Nocardia sp. alder85J]MCX4094021.1 DAK2 domain-containing protein [Nocardia sp. alder85J]
MPGVRDALDGAALVRWGQLCLDGLERHRDEINALNVFPVPDADTGTNLLSTMRAAVAGGAAVLEAERAAGEPAGRDDTGTTSSGRPAGTSGIARSERADSAEAGNAVTLGNARRVGATASEQGHGVPPVTWSGSDDAAGDARPAGSGADRVADGVRPVARGESDRAEHGVRPVGRDEPDRVSDGESIGGGRGREAVTAEVVTADVDTVDAASVNAPDHEVRDGVAGTVAAAMARAATLGARGNSGIILSQVLRGFGDAAASGSLGAEELRIALRRAGILVREGLSDPIEGTMLTVLDAAAHRAAECAQGASLGEVATAAADGAAKALGETPSQLDVLRTAGVVDAGARGLLVLLDGLVALTTGQQTVRPRYRSGADARRSGSGAASDLWRSGTSGGGVAPGIPSFRSAGRGVVPDTQRSRTADSDGASGIPSFGSTGSGVVPDTRSGTAGSDVVPDMRTSGSNGAGISGDHSIGGTGPSGAVGSGRPEGARVPGPEVASAVADGAGECAIRADGPVAHDARPPVDGAGGTAPQYEVMYVLSGTDAGLIAGLRWELARLGDSVVVVGDGAGSWSAHVHTADAGAAVEAGLRAGELRGIRIEGLESGPVAFDGADRGILTVAFGAGAAQLFEDAGAVVLDGDVTADALLAAIRAMPHREVLVLANGALPAPELVTVSVAARGTESVQPRREVLMLPSGSMVQGLAALAVHDAQRTAVDDVFAMSEAAAATRWGAVRVAAERALTIVGTCARGDGLGLVGHDVVVIDPDVRVAARTLLDRMLGLGGELVTLLVGVDSPEGLGDELTEHITATFPGVEVVVYDGGQPVDLIQIGVE